MFGARVIARHAHLVNEMAARVGADLPAALADGRLSAEGLRAAVMRCTGCANPGDCAHWLEATAEAEAAPGYCGNGELFAALKEAGDR
jgi:hypothetical protein